MRMSDLSGLSGAERDAIKARQRQVIANPPVPRPASASRRAQVKARREREWQAMSPRQQAEDMRRQIMQGFRRAGWLS